MHIGEFCNKYKLKIRDVDYLVNTGVIHTEEGTGGSGKYRDFGPTAEEEAKMIVIIRGMGVSTNQLRKYMELLDCLKKNGFKDMWTDTVIKPIEENRKALVTAYDLALSLADEIRESL